MSWLAHLKVIPTPAQETIKLPAQEVVLSSPSRHALSKYRLPAPANPIPFAATPR